MADITLCGLYPCGPADTRIARSIAALEKTHITDTPEIHLSLYLTSFDDIVVGEDPDLDAINRGVNH